MPSEIEKYRELSERHADICSIIYSVSENGTYPILIPDLLNDINPGHYVSPSTVFIVLQDMVADNLVERGDHGYHLTEAGKQLAQKNMPIEKEPTRPGPRRRISPLAKENCTERPTMSPPKALS